MESRPSPQEQRDDYPYDHQHKDGNPPQREPEPINCLACHVAPSRLSEPTNTRCTNPVPVRGRLPGRFVLPHRTPRNVSAPISQAPVSADARLSSLGST